MCTHVGSEASGKPQGLEGPVTTSLLQGAGQWCQGLSKRASLLGTQAVLVLNPPCLLHVYGCVCVHTHPYTCTCTGCMYEHVAWCGGMYMYIVHVCVYMYIHVHMSIVVGDP